jgi:hypothetical protein
MHLTAAQAVAWVATAAAAWLMVRAGAAKGAVRVKVKSRCAACGRRRNRGLCPCTSGD